MKINKNSKDENRFQNDNQPGNKKKKELKTSNDASQTGKTIAKRATRKVEGPLSRVQPDLLRRNFVVARPYTVICVDFHRFNCTIAQKTTELYLFIALDLATGKVVAHALCLAIDSRKAVKVLINFLLEAESISPERDWVILHSDRGTEFRSDVYLNIPNIFPYVKLSMSGYATPVDNAPVERVFRTFKNIPEKWIEATGHLRNDNYESFSDAETTWFSFISTFNETHKNLRSLYRTPNEINAALILYETIVKDTLQFDLSSNKDQFASTHQNEAKNAIIQYKKEAIQFYDQASPEQQELWKLKQQLTRMEKLLAASVNNQEVMAEGIAKRLDDQTLTILNAIQKSKYKKPAKPRTPRTPLDFSLQLLLHTQALSGQITVVAQRNVLAILLIAALGCRISEVYKFTKADLMELMHTKKVEVFVPKRRKAEVKVCSEEHAQLLMTCFDALETNLKLIKFTYDLDSYLFVDFDSDVPKLLNKAYFNTTINKMLETLQDEINQVSGAKTHLRSHSGRINLATELFSQGVSIDVIRQMLGHDDVRSTLMYNRFVFGSESRIDLLNKVRASLRANKTPKNEN